MQLTLHADYSLRVLLYLAETPSRLVSTQEISEAYGISRHHLVRVVQTLHEHGFVKVSPGRNGGAKLSKDPAAINLADVVRAAEPNFRIVECFDPVENTCPIIGACKLQSVLGEALAAFFRALEPYTLADLVSTAEGQSISSLLQISPLHRPTLNRPTLNRPPATN